MGFNFVKSISSLTSSFFSMSSLFHSEKSVNDFRRLIDSQTEYVESGNAVDEINNLNIRLGQARSDKEELETLLSHNGALPLSRAEISAKIEELDQEIETLKEAMTEFVQIFDAEGHINFISLANKTYDQPILAEEEFRVNFKVTVETGMDGDPTLGVEQQGERDPESMPNPIETLMKLGYIKENEEGELISNLTPFEQQIVYNHLTNEYGTEAQMDELLWTVPYPISEDPFTQSTIKAYFHTTEVDGNTFVYGLSAEQQEQFTESFMSQLVEQTKRILNDTLDDAKAQW